MKLQWGCEHQKVKIFRKENSGGIVCIETNIKVSLWPCQGSGGQLSIYDRFYFFTHHLANDYWMNKCYYTSTWCLLSRVSKRLYNVNGVGVFYEGCGGVCRSIQTLQRHEFSRYLDTWEKPGISCQMLLVPSELCAGILNLFSLCQFKTT